MSNPAVIGLIRRKINGRSVWLDDNIGESIHIHIDNFRADLTLEEFRTLCSDIYDTINELIDAQGFDCRKIDPTYLEFMLRKNLMKLKSIRLINVQLKDLFCYFTGGWEPLPNSFGMRVLNGEIRSSRLKQSAHIGQTDQQRFESVLESIKKNGYPYDGQYIYVRENGAVQDGAHRACALYKLYGNIEIPVMCLCFDDSVPLPSLKRRNAFHKLTSKSRKIYRALTGDKKPLLKKIYERLKAARSRLKGLLKVMKAYRRKIYLSRHPREAAEISKIFSSK